MGLNINGHGYLILINNKLHTTSHVTFNEDEAGPHSLHPQPFDSIYEMPPPQSPAVAVPDAPAVDAPADVLAPAPA